MRGGVHNAASESRSIHCVSVVLAPGVMDVVQYIVGNCVLPEQVAFFQCRSHMMLADRVIHELWMELEAKAGNESE